MTDSGQRDVYHPTPPPGGSGDDDDTVGMLIDPDGEEHPVGYGGVRVGRGEDADLSLTDRTVSRHHADVRFENGRYVLYDHSSNGTWVNDKLVVVAQPLRDGDEVKFGGTRFRFQVKTATGRRSAPEPEAEDLISPTGTGSTVRMKGGKATPKSRGGGGKWIRIVLFVVLLIVLAALAANHFPDVARDLLDRLPL